MRASKKLLGNRSEASFTLFETIVALGIMATMMVEVASVQGNTIYFSEYGQRATQAAWLAKRVMSQVEYNWVHRDFSDIKEVEVPEAPFEDAPEFKYSLTIKNWKLPIAQIIANGGSLAETEEEEEKEEGKEEQNADSIGGLIKQFLGDELLKVAHVKVIWAEGAKTNDVSLTFLMTNQRKVDEAIATYGASSQSAAGSGSGSGQNQGNQGQQQQGGQGQQQNDQGGQQGGPE